MKDMANIEKLTKDTVEIVRERGERLDARNKRMQK